MHADPQPTPYRCPHGLGWHLGHLPASIRRGQGDRREYEQRATQRTLQKGQPNP